MWAMRGFINPSIMFPGRSAATASGMIFLLFSPRAFQHARITSAYTWSFPFAVSLGGGANTRPLNFRYWKKPSSNAPAIFLSSLTRQAGEEGVAQLVLRRPISIWRSVVYSRWIWWIPIVPSGLFMQERVSFNTRCQSYNILPQNKICQNILSSSLQMNNSKVGRATRRAHSLYF